MLLFVTLQYFTSTWLKLFQGIDVTLGWTHCIKSGCRHGGGNFFFCDDSRADLDLFNQRTQVHIGQGSQFLKRNSLFFEPVVSQRLSFLNKELTCLDYFLTESTLDYYQSQVQIMSKKCFSHFLKSSLLVENKKNFLHGF